MCIGECACVGEGLGRCWCVDGVPWCWCVCGALRDVGALGMWAYEWEFPLPLKHNDNLSLSICPDASKHGESPANRESPKRRSESNHGR